MQRRREQLAPVLGRGETAHRWNLRLHERVGGQGEHEERLDMQGLASTFNTDIDQRANLVVLP